jgi:hypothetical protein
LTDRADGWSGYLSGLVAAGGFVLGGCLVAEAGVQPGAAVPADVLGDDPAGAGPGRPGLQVDQLAFERTEEALGQAVVPALTGAAVRLIDVEPGGQRGELSRCVLGGPCRSESSLPLPGRGRRRRWPAHQLLDGKPTTSVLPG